MKCLKASRKRGFLRLGALRLSLFRAVAVKSGLSGIAFVTCLSALLIQYCFREVNCLPGVFGERFVRVVVA